MKAELLLRESEVSDFLESLRMDEKSENTSQKYKRDIKNLVTFIKNQTCCTDDAVKITRSLLLLYKEHLQSNYLLTSANSMIASVNAMLKYLGREELCVKTFRIQRKIYQREDRFLKRREYERLLNEARRQGKERLLLIIETMASIGIRISELRFVTVEAVRAGRMQIVSKGKAREIYFPKKLRKSLAEYIQKKKIKGGMVFCTASGKAVDRSNICHEMKKLAEDAGVNPKKVFPHNLRHLFAREFYAQERNIVALADILGHSSLETTRIYTQTSAKEHLGKLDKLKFII